MGIIKKHWSLAVIITALLIILVSWYYLHSYLVSTAGQRAGKNSQNANAQASKKKGGGGKKENQTVPLY